MDLKQKKTIFWSIVITLFAVNALLICLSSGQPNIRFPYDVISDAIRSISIIL
jgi:hypothetical protein